MKNLREILKLERIKREEITKSERLQSGERLEKTSLRGNVSSSGSKLRK